MSSPARVLLVEHVDAIGSAPADARLRAGALRAAGITVDCVVLEDGEREDLLFPSQERRTGQGIETFTNTRHGLTALAARVRSGRADFVLWAGATPGGGECARSLPGDVPAAWWATGHAPPAAKSGPLRAVDPVLAPVEGSAIAEDRVARQRLALWDGPFALVPAPPSTRTAEGLIDAFARAADGRDEVDLVVLDHPEPGLEALARRAGVGQRVHFVGPAPREAEHAWLTSAAVSLLCGDVPVSGGLVLRSLACGCPLLPVGATARPLAAWLRDRELGWWTGDDVASMARSLDAALERSPDVLAVRERGRAVARAADPAGLGTRVAAAIRSRHAHARRAA